MVNLTNNNLSSYNRIFRFFVFLALMLLGYSLLFFVFLIENLVVRDGFADTELLMLQFLLFETLPVILFFIIFKNKINVKKSLSLRKISFINLGYILVLQICISPLITLVNYIGLFFADNVTVEYINSMDMPFLLMMLLIGIIGPALEEIIFRGIILDITRGKSLRFMAIVSGITFALFHMDINQFSYAFILGTVFAVYVTYTGSIFSAFFAHFLVNGSSVVLLGLQKYILNNFPEYLDESLTSTELVFNIYEFIFIIISAIIFMIGFKFIFKKFKKYNEENNEYFMYGVGASLKKIEEDVV